MEKLAESIISGDGVANAAIREAGQRIIELSAARDEWKANHDNQVELKRIIAARPGLKERAPMVEKLMAERNRAQSWSIRQHERIVALERIINNPDKPSTAEILAGILERIKSGDESKEDCANYQHVAGEISAYGAMFLEAMNRQKSRRKSRPQNS
ncbi:MAG: hypothetical protein WCP45_13525 [Verrucomicrobiota bacterium]